MAIFKITPSTSVFTAFPGPAFNSDTSGADTLIVDSAAFLIAVNGDGAFLANTGAWTVNVNGSIVSQSTVGIHLQAGNVAVSTISIGANGQVQGDIGVRLDSPANIHNAGQISGAIVLASNGTYTITNSGTIIDAVASISDLGGDSIDIVRNSGQIVGNLFLGGGNDRVTNSGSISGIIFLEAGTNRLINSGTLGGDVEGGSGADTVSNAGKIFANVHLSGGNDTMTNSGTIIGIIDLASGTNRLTNSGQVFGNVTAGDASDTVTDFALVGDIMKSGLVIGTISLGAGDDKFTGGANSETVQDGNGADLVALGGGKDTYIATGNSGGDGIDTVRGGAGVDTYDANAAAGPVVINLDTVSHSFAANTATGTAIAGSAKDSIFGFENANGGAGPDIIYGSAAANSLIGAVGGDFLAGFGGNDTLDGGTGFDALVGGVGKDQLTGGADADLFEYNALSDSGVTAGTRDLIADFEPGIDQIHLFGIDANTTNAAGTNDAFTFIGTNVPFTGTAGQLHAFWSAIGQIIEGDVNGDAKPDFSIEIADPTHAITLASASFVL
jgi:hypothetical protein